MNRGTGFLHWAFAAMIAVAALGVLLSGRDLSQAFQELAHGFTVHPLVPWAQRVVSLIVLAAAGERIASHLLEHKPMPSVVLTAAFLVYWATTVAAPALLGAHRHVSHEYLYPLILGSAALLATGSERDRIIDTVRNALLIFLAAGLALIPVMPGMVMESSYGQGLIPGLPRHGGLAAHAVALGMFTQTALICLWCRPFARRWLNLSAWMLGLTVLFIAQSKAAWIAFFICAMAIFAVRQVPSMWRRMGDPRETAFGAVVCLGMMAVAAGLLAVLLFGDLGGQVANFSESAQGAQLMSMTGRDKIWAVALEEWQSNGLFGYGLTLWDDAFRASIGMPNATSGHNQFIDTLARSGTVGAAGLVVYAAVLLVMSLRYARATGGLSLALFLVLAMLSVSEVPLLIIGYGAEIIPHLLLIVTLAAAAAGTRAPARQMRPRPVYHTAST